MAIIYKCTNTVTNKIYVGVTTRTLSIRKHEHLKELNLGKKRGVWQEEYIKYGEDCFIFSIECEVPLDSLYSEEIKTILKYNSLQPNGYNKTLLNGPIYQNIDLLKQSKHSLDCLVQIVTLSLSEPYLEISEIANKCNVTTDVVADLLRCKTYTWLEEYIPDLYSIVKLIHHSKLVRSTYLKSSKFLNILELYINTNLTDTEIALETGTTTSMVRDLVRGKAYHNIQDIYYEQYLAATSLYSKRQQNRTSSKIILDINTNISYTFNTCAEGSRLIGIDARRVSDLVSGKMKKYKSFIPL